MKVMHSPKQTDKGKGSIESWYGETGMDDPRKYGPCKGALLNVLSFLDIIGMPEYDDIKILEGIFMWNVTYVIDNDATGDETPDGLSLVVADDMALVFPSITAWAFVSILTEQGHKFYHIEA